MKFTCSLLLFISIFGHSLAQSVGTWRNVGPIQFPVNVTGQVDGMGRVSQIKFHVSNPAKMYAVSASGGLFISTDTGRNWAPTAGTELLPTTSCSAVCVDYTNDSIMYLSTGDQNYYGDSYGIYKTINAGNTWVPANTNIGTRMAVDIIMDPLNHSIVIAATTDGIWKTTNGGGTWTKTLSTGTFKSMKAKPGSNHILYAATGSLFYRSLDMGSTWTNITSGVSVPTGNEGIRIAVTPADTNVVFLGVTDSYGQILKSTNGGSSFTNIYSSSTQCIVCYDSTITSGSQGYYNYNLTVNPANANELLLVSHCVWRSVDGGNTWSWRTQWWNQVHTDMHQIEFNPYDLSMRFNANDGGVWLSRDTLATLWETRSNGLAATEMYHAAQSPVNRQMISAGTQDNGELYFDGIWKCNRGGDWGPHCAMDYLGNNTVYYAYGYRRDLAPLGGDQSYNPPFTTRPEFNIEFLPTMHNLSFIATDSIWRSNDINTTSPSWTFLYTNGEPFKSLASCRADANILYAVTDNMHLLRSDNALSVTPTFTTMSTPAGTSVMASLATNRHNSSVVSLTCGTKIYRSANKGVSWTDITGALPSLNILKVIADDYSSTERLFVCLGNYVYYKDNTTTAWTLSNGLPTIMNISDFMVYNDSTSASILRLSTYGRGAWECNIQNNLPPSGIFAANKQYLCVGDTVHYHKNIYGNVSSFSWSFPGGVPSTSVADSPVVVYTALGTYPAVLTVIGAFGNDTITRASYINVSHGSSSSVTEGFESGSFPPSPQWFLKSQSGVNWAQSALAGGFGGSTHSMVFDNFDNDAGGRHDRILLPKTDLTYATSAFLKFDVAYSYYPGYRDTLMVDVSTDCGATFTTVYLKDTNWLATAPDTTVSFVPTSTGWRTDSVSLNAFLGTGIEIAFDNVGHYGQNIYIDNVNLHVTIPPNLGVSPLSAFGKIAVYPNPTTGSLTINGSGVADGSVAITCFNILGMTVARSAEIVTNGCFQSKLDLSGLQHGIYLIKVQSATGESYMERVVLQ